MTLSQARHGGFGHPTAGHRHPSSRDGRLHHAVAVKISIVDDDGLFVATCREFPTLLLGSENMVGLLNEIPEVLKVLGREKFGEEPEVLPALPMVSPCAVIDTWVLLFRRR